jgi:hypothetical protein
MEKQAARSSEAPVKLQQSRVLQARWRLTFGLETCLAHPPPIGRLIVAQPHFSHSRDMPKSLRRLDHDLRMIVESVQSCMHYMAPTYRCRSDVD